MPIVVCPIPGCDYITEDLDAAIVAALITTHSAVHSTSKAAKVEKVKRLTVTAACTSEEWAYFMSRWSDYADTTKVTGRHKVIQLLECCDEPLHKELKRAAGGGLTNTPAENVLAAIRKLTVREENTQRRFPGGPTTHWAHPGSSDRLHLFFSGRVVFECVLHGVLFTHHAHA